MKKFIWIIVPVVIIIAGAIFYFFFFNKQAGISLLFLKPSALKSGDTDWIYDKVIAEPIQSTSTSQNDVKLGDLNTQSVNVVIAKGAFDQDTEVEILTPETVPQYYGSELEMIGSPLEISAGQPARLNEKMTVSFKVDKDLLTGDKSFFRVVYFSGEQWEYIKPTAIDAEQGIITFDSYHLSLFGASKIKDETKLIEQWSHSQALDNTLRKNINDKVDYVAEQIIEQILEKMGLEGESVKAKVLKDLLTDDGYRDIYDAATKQGDDFDPIDLGQKIALLSGKKIAQIVDESMLQKGLEAISGDAAEDFAAVAKAAGKIIEGDYKEGAKIIGEQIADKFLITTAGKIAVEVIDYQIESWKNSEVEAAYKAYKNGSNAKFFGYNVDAGDFDAVWRQMRGIGRQLVIEAIKKENAIRAESGMPLLSEKQEDAIREKVKESYRQQFASRSKQEDEIKKREDDIKKLMEAFKDKEFFDDTFGPDGLDKGYAFEQKMEILYHFTEKMMKDTGREWFVDLKGLKSDKNLLIDQITLAASYYFTKPDGKKLYYDYLKREFGLEFFPELKDLAGSWPNGSMTITDVIVPENWKEEVEKNKAAGDDLGCDFTIDPAMLKGQVLPFTLTLNPTGENNGTLIFGNNKGEEKTTSFTYSAGVLKATISEKGAVGNINLIASEDDNNYSLNGTFNISYAGMEIKTTATSTKAKPQPPAPVPKE